MLPNKTNAIVSGSLAGFVTGFNGTGGAIRGISMAAFNLHKDVFIATSAAVDFGVDLSRSVIYIDHGYFGKDQLYLVPFLIVISFAGSFIGKKLLNKIDETFFKKIVLALVLSIGTVILYQESSKLF
ncbi:MAG: TSUP family transporter [Bacteroidia bacterium]